MSNKKTGLLVLDGEWRKHLRKWGKKFFWKRHRQAEVKFSKRELKESVDNSRESC